LFRLLVRIPCKIGSAVGSGLHRYPQNTFNVGEDRVTCTTS